MNERKKTKPDDAIVQNSSREADDGELHGKGSAAFPVWWCCGGGVAVD